jgi:penicillin-binding protein 2
MYQENSYMLPGVIVQEAQIRLYLEDFSLSHILGYIGRITEKEKDTLYLTHAVDLNVGKGGVEKIYESPLRGDFGWKEVESNAFGADIRELSYHESKDGQNITLTINKALQQYIYELCKDLVATVVVSEVTNGNIVSLISTPSFDNNKITNSADKSYWKKLSNDPNKPFINRAIQSLYPPGSTFKVVTILAALKAGISKDMIFNCKGKIFLGNSTFRCWNRSGHGPLDMKGALVHSCNCYIYNIAKIIGHDQIIQIAKMLGLGKKSQIDLPFEKEGIVAGIDWKKKITGKSWSLGDTYNLSMGQGFLSVTALQMSSLINCIATKGKIFEPRICHDKLISERTIDLPKTYFDFLHDALFCVVNEQGGTAFKNRNYQPSEIFSGKTGTSQVMAKKHDTDDLSSITKPWHHRNHGIFIGFNSNNPKHSVSIIVEHGGSGSAAAAPIAQKIFQRLALNA